MSSTGPHRACNPVPEAYVIRALTAHGSGDGADWHQTGRPFMKPVPIIGQGVEKVSRDRNCGQTPFRLRVI